MRWRHVVAALMLSTPVLHAPDASAAERLRITTTSVPDTVVGAPLTVRFEAAGGTPPYRWELTDWNGLVIAANTGVARGSLRAAGPNRVAVLVTDARGRQATAEFSARGRLGRGPLGAQWVHRDGGEIVIDGPSEGQQRRVQVPDLAGRVVSVSPDGRWATVDPNPLGSRTMREPWFLVDLTDGSRVDGILGCERFSPGGAHALCLTGGGATVVVRDMATGSSAPLELPEWGQLGGWIDDDTMWFTEWAPGPTGTEDGSTNRVRAVPADPPVTPGPVLLDYGNRWLVDMLDRSTAVVAEPGGGQLSVLSADGNVRPLSSAGATCLVDHRHALVACATPLPTPQMIGDGPLMRWSFPASAALRFVDARTGRSVRTVTRTDCVPTPLHFTVDGTLVADCVPATTSAMGRRTITTAVDSFRHAQLDNLWALGISLVVDPASGSVEVGPKLPAFGGLALAG